MLEHKVRDGEREVVLQFEHSLLSLSKWESKHKKAFLATPTKTHAELVDYFGSMLLNPDETEDIIIRLSPDQMDELSNYINEQQTASSVPQEGPRRGQAEIVTSELIYYWMVALRIPFHPAETWHLSRLMMLIQITNFKSQPEKKRNVKAALSDWARLNQQNKERFGTSG